MERAIPQNSTSPSDLSHRKISSMARNRRRPEMMQVTELLRIIGFKPKELGLCNSGYYVHRNKGPLFKRLSTGELYALLESARDRYRQSMKEVHPDRGGSHVEAALITRSWKRVKLLFARRGIYLG